MSRTRTPLTLNEHLQRIRAQFPDIRPSEEDDLEWWNQGLKAFNAGQLDLAERIFKKLVLSEPVHFDGFHGLARVYQRQRRKNAAIVFADEAIRLAQKFLDDGSLEPDTMQALIRHRSELDAPNPSP